MDIRNVALVQNRDLHFFNLALARELRKRFNCRIHLLVNSAEGVNAHQAMLADGTVDTVSNYECFYQAAETAIQDEDAVFTRARQYERAIGISYNEIFMSQRDVGHGFSLGGFLHPRVPGVDKLSYAQCVHGMNEQLAFWESFATKYGIDLILNGMKDAAAMSRALGIPFRSLYNARVDNRSYWAVDEFLAIPGLEALFDALSNSRFEAVKVSDPYFQEVLHRKRFFGGNQISKLARKIYEMTKRQLYLMLKGHLGIRNYSYWGTLASYYRQMIGLAQMSRPPLVSLKAMQGKTFVFFPLQTEPEQSLQWMSPECFSQLAVIASLARDLPAGVVLAVKETIHGIGRRPRDFYAQIMDFKNVVMLDVRETGVDVIRSAAAVATISGTAGLEAAISGKPVLLFGRHNGYGFLGHVFEVFQEESLRPALAQALSADAISDQSRRQGAQLRQAIVDSSFDMGGYTNVDLHSFDENVILRAVDALIASLSAEGPQPRDRFAPAVSAPQAQPLHSNLMN